MEISNTACRAILSLIQEPGTKYGDSAPWRNAFWTLKALRDSVHQAMPRFIQGSRPCAARIPDRVWEEHKATILSMYLDSNKTLEYVMNTMERDYGFFAT